MKTLKCCRRVCRSHLNVGVRLTPSGGGPVGPKVYYAGLNSRSELLRSVLLAHPRDTWGGPCLHGNTRELIPRSSGASLLSHRYCSFTPPATGRILATSH